MKISIPLYGLCVTGLLLWSAGCGHEAATPPPPPKVSVAHPELRQLVDYDQYNGWLEAVKTVEVLRPRARSHSEGEFRRRANGQRRRSAVRIGSSTFRG